MAGTIQYLQSHTDTSDTNSYTFSSANLGTADSSRCIIVGIVSRKAGATTSISSVTVGGVSATIVKQQVNHATNTNVSGIAIAEVPTGTTGNIVVTFADSMLRCAVSVYRATGLSSTTPHDTDGSTASAPSVSLDVPTNGFAIGMGLSAASTTATWTGLTENIDGTLESWVTYSSAHKEFASGATGETMTVTFGSSSEPAGSFASWQLLSDTADSERGLYLGGKTSSGSERPLRISGSQILSTDYFNVEFGSASTNADSERGLYIKGKDTSASERGLYLGGKLSGSSERGLYSSGELTDSSDRLLYSEGSIAESSDRLLYSKGNATNDSDRLVYTKGIATSSSDRLLNTAGKLPGESDRGLYTIGAIPEDYADSERLIRTKGISTSSSDRGLYSVGGGVVDSERGLYALAEAIGDSERGIYTTGKETGFSLRNLYTKGFNSSSSDRLLYTGGAAGGSSDRAIYSSGVLRSFSDRLVYTIGVDTSSSGRRIYTCSVEPGLSERDLYTIGAGSGSSEIPIYTGGFETDSSERGVYSRGGIPSSSTRNLYIKGTWKPWVDKFVEYGTIYTDEGVTVGGSFVDLKMSGSDSFSNDSATAKTWVDTKVSVTDNFIRKI